MAPKKKKGEAFRTISRVSRAVCVCERELVQRSSARVRVVACVYELKALSLLKNLNSLFGYAQRVRAARRRRQNFFPKQKD